MSISATTDQYIYTETIQLIATTEFLFCVSFVKPYIMSLGSISFDKEIIILISLAMFIVLFSPCSTSMKRNIFNALLFFDSSDIVVWTLS